MNKKFLIISEGSVTEPNIFVKLFEKYGFIVRKESPIQVGIQNTDFSSFQKYEIMNETQDVIIIAQGPRNRIKDLISLYNNTQYNIESFFTNAKDLFAGIFLIYDVDQTLSDMLNTAFNKFNNEQDGLLLVSSSTI